MSLELWPVFDARRAENPVKPQRWFTYLAMGHAAVGDLDRAFEALERAYQARSAGLIYVHLDPSYEPLRSDPRYSVLINRLGLR